MVNTRTDADLSAAVQNALQTLLPQIREEIREEFCTGSGTSNAGGNPPPTSTETSTEFMQRFLRLAGFLGVAAGTEEEQAKNFQWCLRRQVQRLARSSCNASFDLLDSSGQLLAPRRSRQRNGDRHHPTSQQSSHISHGQNNDHHGSDRRGGNDNHHRSNNNNNYSSSNNRKNITTNTSGQADKKPGASGRVFAITEGQATNTLVISSTFASRITTTPMLLDHVLCISMPM
nr:hypothetical protein [Tanacetum cinerariifolium]